MKRNIVRTTFFLATLFLSLAAVAPAQDVGICSKTGVAGEWAYTFTGTLFPAPTVAIPIAAVGKGTFDRDGNYQGMQTTSLGGSVENNTLTGTGTVNSDCTGTLTIDIKNPSGVVTRTAVVDIVFDDNGTEFRGIFRSLALVSGSVSNPVPAVITQNGRKVFNGKQ